MKVESVLPRDAIPSISIHFALRDFPRAPEKIAASGPVHSEEVPGILEELLEQAVDLHTDE